VRLITDVEAISERSLQFQARPAALRSREEAFGPVLLLEAADDFEHAIARANDSRFGLQAGVFTAAQTHAMRAWEALEVGGVVIGDVPTVRVDRMPYGGVKDSGLGREGPRWAMDDFTETRLLLATSNGPLP
jgi:acyl-CoA reductase-like NAD-dependent aldehyde dehydrogenase